MFSRRLRQLLRPAADELVERRLAVDPRTGREEIAAYPYVGYGWAGTAWILSQPQRTGG